MAINSSSSYLAFLQNPRCPGATGNTGPRGPSGVTGATGPRGIDGLTTGLIYYFRTEEAGQPNNQPVQGNVGPTGFSMNTAQLSGATPIYSSILGPTGSTNSVIADFRLPFNTSTPMPAGNWVFTQNLYSFNTSTTGTIATKISPYINQISSGGTATALGGSSSIYFNVDATANQNADENGYIATVPVKNTTFSAGDSLQVVFKVNSGLVSNQEIQFWTEGDSISQVVTTFSPQSGPTGAPGAPGTNGINGATGPTGPAGVINGTPYQLAFYGTDGSSTGSSTFAVNTNPTANAILLASPTAGVDTGVNFGVPGASSSITFNGTNLRLVYNGVDKLYANGPLVTSPGSFQVNGTTYLSGATQTQQVQSTSITSIGDIIAQGSFIQPLSSVGNNWTSGTTATVTTNAGTANISPAAGVVDFTLTNAGWNTASGQCILFIQQTEPENTNGGVFQYLIDPVPPNSFRVRKTFTDGGAKTVFWQAIRSV